MRIWASLTSVAAEIRPGNVSGESVGAAHAAKLVDRIVPAAAAGHRSLEPTIARAYHPHTFPLRVTPK